jgi:AcrR family transcriptional regulator
MPDHSTALSGRRGQAVRNNEVILAAARDVFLADPTAPIAAVAKLAGVGISALYRRYASKEDLLRRLCEDGLQRYVAEAEAAAGITDGWAALAGFLHNVVEADVHSLTVKLAGTFTPTPEMRRLAQRANALTVDLVERACADGRLRPDVVTEDVGLLLEACAAIRVPDQERTIQLRRRFLAVFLDGLTAQGPPLPGPPPAPGEFSSRWKAT